MKPEEPSVQRINFIEREPFVLTYRRMLEGGGVLAAVFLILFGIQFLRVHFADKQLQQTEAEVQTLREESDRLFKQMAALGGAQSAKEVLSNLFEKTAPWATMLKELTATAPRSVWLVSLKSRPSPGSSGMPGLEMSGRSEEAGSVAQFLKSLTSSTFFQDVVLATSKHESMAGADVYSFIIDLSVASPEGKGL